MQSDLERVLGDDYLGDLQRRPMPEVRAMRGECQEIETGLSYLRRLVQGHLDIVGSELERRRAGGDPADLSALIGSLPEILSDRTRTPGVGRLPQLMAPGDLDAEFTAELQEIGTAGRLDSLPEVSDVDLDGLREQLQSLEERVSARRRQLFGRIDELQAEITRRYRTGEASVESLLQ
jgi:hypothetical protein